MKNRRRNNMKLKNRIKYAGMAAALALSLTTSTFAAQAPTQNDPAPYDHANTAKGGDTIISVYETRINTGNLSVEVPLYLTLAVVADTNTVSPTLAAPNNYYIKNTSTDGKGNAAPYPIGITGVHIDSLKSEAGGGWRLGAYNGGAAGDKGAGTGNDKAISLCFTGKTWSFNNVNNKWELGTTDASFEFPAVSWEQSFSCDTLRYDKANDGAADPNLFSPTGGNSYNPIPAGEKLLMTIDGGVASGYRVQDANLSGTAAAPAVPQFRVTYTVSALDKTTLEPIGAPYAGDIFGPAPNHGLLDAEQDSNFDDQSNPK